MSYLPIIAIDGPAASGKSSTGAGVAGALGLAHLDSGALYRAVTWVALQSNLTDAAAITQAAAELPLTLRRRGADLVVEAGGHPIGEAIRDSRVTAHVSAVSAMPLVRDWVNRLLRDSVRLAGGAVVDGRDIGTVVFPDASIKVFLIASPEVRARRRLLQRGTPFEESEVQREAFLLAERDRRDSTRLVAPLVAAADAVVLDTTSLTLAEQVSRIAALARSRGLSGA